MKGTNLSATLLLVNIPNANKPSNGPYVYVATFNITPIILGLFITKWLDAGIVVNYFYSEQRDYIVFDDKLKQNNYGGGGFLRLFPVRFLFAQGQIEHNWIKVKYVPPNGGVTDENSVSGTSFLVGPGYTTGRDPDNKSPFGYFAVLWDVLKNRYSPYLNSAGRATPIIRAGINIPLFQGRKADF